MVKNHYYFTFGAFLIIESLEIHTVIAQCSDGKVPDISLCLQGLFEEWDEKFKRFSNDRKYEIAAQYAFNKHCVANLFSYESDQKRQIATDVALCFACLDRKEKAVKFVEYALKMNSTPDIVSTHCNLTTFKKYSVAKNGSRILVVCLKDVCYKNAHDMCNGQKFDNFYMYDRQSRGFYHS